MFVTIAIGLAAVAFAFFGTMMLGRALGRFWHIVEMEEAIIQMAVYSVEKEGSSLGRTVERE